MNNIIKLDHLEISSKMLTLISEIDEFKGAWKALGKLTPERLNALRKVATIESIGSSTRIEGSKLSDREVEKLLSNLETESFASRDEQEVAGYAVTMQTIFENYENISLTENYIKQLHKMLLRHSTKDERHRGEYKNLPNHVEAFSHEGKSLGVVFETAAPFDTPIQMEALMNWLRKAIDSKDLHPLIITGVFTVVFLAIHPFQDGNGRLSRILTTLLLLKAGYAFVPYSSLESIIEQNKEGYYLALRRTQGTLRKQKTDWSAWLLFFLRALQKQKKNLEQKVEREKLMRAALPELSIKIIELATEHGQISTADVIKVTKVHRNTVKQHLNELLKSGHLKRGGKGRGIWYTLA